MKYNLHHEHQMHLQFCKIYHATVDVPQTVTDRLIQRNNKSFHVHIVSSNISHCHLKW